MRGRFLVAAAIAFVSLITSAASADAAIPRPDRLPLSVGGDAAVDQPLNDGLGGSRVGSWTLDGAHLDSIGRLSVRVEVTPPATGLPIRSGPAVLFARLDLIGGVGGDIGWQGTTGHIAAVPLAACDEARCHYTGRISLPTRPLYALAARQQYLESVHAELELTLVRTFGQGRWLQVLPLLSLRGVEGTLASPGLHSGVVGSNGVFPASHASPSYVPGAPADRSSYSYAPVVEQLRRTMADPSDPVKAVAATVDLTLHDCTYYWVVAIHDADGNLPFITLVDQRREIHERVTLPDDRTWTLTSEGDEGIFMFTPGPDSAGMDVGTFETTGQDLAITADLTCGLNPTGSMTVVHAELPPTEAAAPEASSADWQLPGVASALLALWALTGALWLRRGRVGRVRPEA